MSLDFQNKNFYLSYPPPSLSSTPLPLYCSLSLPLCPFHLPTPSTPLNLPLLPPPSKISLPIHFLSCSSVYCSLPLTCSSPLCLYTFHPSFIYSSFDHFLNSSDMPLRFPHYLSLPLYTAPLNQATPLSFLSFFASCPPLSLPLSSLRLLLSTYSPQCPFSAPLPYP